ncbi:MAG: hypothetical protein EZS28_040459 [Streblomastix strix]|uniref:Protein kinase domain-containing protein n=1 Tax=Streblomastix strix TaxID=222440 RepID=A0A5J4U0Q3_9EUKA|nr:MAG: hypothetical protein EZS28_040459 [Streblomastix strix]
MYILQFERKDRPTAEQALQHPYFTNPQAKLEISQDVYQITAQSLEAQNKGDSSITMIEEDIIQTWRRYLIH